MQNKQCGSALITALFIMTLIAIAATAMSTRLQLDIYRTRTSIDGDKLYLASQAVTGWALTQLSMDKLVLKSRDKTGKLLEYPLKLKNIYPGVTIEGRLFDMQASFNINNLINKKSQMLFYILLENASEKTSSSQRKQIVDATTQWINAYQPEQGHNAFMDFYLKQKPPYYPGYQLMQNISELRLIYGMTPALYKALATYLTALPETTPVNINTASKAVLMTLGNGLNESQVNALIEARGETGILDLAVIMPLLKTLNIPAEQITLESSYFLSVATTSMQNSHLTVYSLIKRVKSKKNSVLLTIVSESLNVR